MFVRCRLFSGLFREKDRKIEKKEKNKQAHADVALKSINMTLIYCLLALVTLFVILIVYRLAFAY